MNRCHLIVLLAGAALAAPSAAAAAAPWSAPVDLGPGAAVVTDPALDFAAAGVPLFSYRFSATEPTGLMASLPDRSAIAVRRADGTIVRTVLRDDAVAHARCGTRCWAVLRYRAPARSDAPALLRVSIGSGPGEAGRPRTLARYRLPEDYDESIVGRNRLQIAALPSGAIAVAWVEGAGRGARLRMALRAPGRAFGAARTVAQVRTGILRHPRIAFHGRSALTVAYVREARAGGRSRRTVEARVVALRGSAGDPQTIGPAPESFTDLRIATSPRGRAVIAWGNVHGTVSGAESRWIVRAALRERAAGRFSRAQLLQRGVVQVGAPGAIGAGVADDGTATVGWSAYTSPSLVSPSDVRVASAAAGRRFGAPQVLSGQGRLVDLTVAGSGPALATWMTFSAAGSVVAAAVRPAAGQPFGTAETVATIASRSFNAVDPDPDAAYDVATRRFSVVWAVDDSAGMPPMHAPGSARLQLATRMP